VRRWPHEAAQVSVVPWAGGAPRRGAGRAETAPTGPAEESRIGLKRSRARRNKAGRTRKNKSGRRRDGKSHQLQGAKGAPVRAVDSPGYLRPTPIWAGAPVRCSCCPPTVSPLVKVRPPRSDFHSVGPLERPSPCGCCTDGAYFREPLWQPGPHSVAGGLPSRKAPPEGRCAEVLPAGRRLGGVEWLTLEGNPSTASGGAAGPECRCPGDPEPTH
jgi:hypothetical protein